MTKRCCSMFLLSVLLLLVLAMPSFASDSAYAQNKDIRTADIAAPDVCFGATQKDAAALKTNDAMVKCFIDEALTTLTFVEFAPMSLALEQRSGVQHGEITLNATVSQKSISTQEREALLDKLVKLEALDVTRGTGSRSDDNTDRQETFTITLRVTYWLDYVNSPAGPFDYALHLDKATGSYDRLVSGATADGSELFWSASGPRYINGEFDRNTPMGATTTYTSGSFSNIQLMPANTAFILTIIPCEVEYTLYFSDAGGDAHELVVGLSFNDLF